MASETDTHTTADTPTVATTAESAARPRINFDTIVWGLLVLGAGTVLLATLRTPGRRDQLVDWALSLTPNDSVLITAIAAGAVSVILGLLAVIRSYQKRPRSNR